MLSILIANPKGGCGKTTLATNLASAYAQGGFSVALADGDRQGSSHAWTDRRPPKSSGVEGLDWRKKTSKPPENVQRLIIDAPAGIRVKSFQELLKTVDVVLVPVLPSAFDRLATVRFVERIEALRPIRRDHKPVALIANRARRGTRRVAALQDAFAVSLHPLVAYIGDRAVYPEVAELGLGIFDRDNSATRRAQEDWTPLITFIETSEYR